MGNMTKLAKLKCGRGRGGTYVQKCPSPQLNSLQVGRPQQLPAIEGHVLASQPWTTAFYKQTVSSTISVHKLGLEGDGQADLVNHGGPDKAICVYSFDHYPYWQKVLSDEQLAPGAFGENFTVADIAESDVCIGDTWRVGDEVIVQVSQPRQPCWKLARRWQRKITRAYEVQENGKTGWYFRVLKLGTVEAGMPLTLVERPHPDWTIARANKVMHHDKHDAGLA